MRVMWFLSDLVCCNLNKVSFADSFISELLESVISYLISMSILRKIFELLLICVFFLVA